MKTEKEIRESLEKILKELDMIYNWICNENKHRSTSLEYIEYWLKGQIQAFNDVLGDIKNRDEIKT
jgi:vacuolar-type H+-ATPase subunit E/Vma4